MVISMPASARIFTVAFEPPAARMLRYRGINEAPAVVVQIAAVGNLGDDLDERAVIGVQFDQLRAVAVFTRALEAADEGRDLVGDATAGADGRHDRVARPEQRQLIAAGALGQTPLQ